MVEYKTNPVKAIREKCLDCCYGQKEEVKLCPCTECPIYPYRLGKNPYRQRKNLTEEEREVLAHRLKEALKTHSTTAEKSPSLEVEK